MNSTVHIFEANLPASFDPSEPEVTVSYDDEAGFAIEDVLLDGESIFDTLPEEIVIEFERRAMTHAKIREDVAYQRWEDRRVMEALGK